VGSQSWRQDWLPTLVTQHLLHSICESLAFKPFGREPRALLVDGNHLDEDYDIVPLV
jgi:hypothetical protein